MGTIAEIAGECPGTAGANAKGPQQGVGRPRSAGGVKDPATPFAFQEGFSPLQREEGKEKQAEVVVQPL